MRKNWKIRPGIKSPERETIKLSMIQRTHHIDHSILAQFAPFKIYIPETKVIVAPVARRLS
jgi:hypothetical protein